MIDIVGLDRQADGGTHVLSTAEVGAVRVVGTESKGKDNKRIRLEVVDPEGDKQRMSDHLIGLLLGAEEDWPRAFEAILRRVGPIKHDGGETHTVSSERLTIEPFGLTDPVRTELVIDRLAYWYYHPREWLKKAALVNGTYLLNSPFTFQSMEKHSAYCAMVRLGLKVPPTTLVPYKNPVDNVRWAYTSETLQPAVRPRHARRGARLPALHEAVRRRRLARRLAGQRPRRPAPAYDESGEMLMHLQATVDYEHFARALSIGPETMVMDFRPDQPMHNRYAVSHGFLSESAGHQAIAISRIVNAFFRWEFNSAEMLVAGDEVYPIDYANACPDVAVTSLHYYFPWAIKALVRWSVYCVGHRPPAQRRPGDRAATSTIADDPALDYDAKLEAYLALADEYFETDRYWDWCSENLPHLDEQVHDWVASDEFDRMLRDTVAGDLPAARAGRVPRPLPRPARPVGQRQRLGIRRGFETVVRNAPRDHRLGREHRSKPRELRRA